MTNPETWQNTPDNCSYLIDDEVPPPLSRDPEPLLETPGALLDQVLPAAAQVLLARLAVNLKIFGCFYFYFLVSLQLLTIFFSKRTKTNIYNSSTLFNNVLFKKRTYNNPWYSINQLIIAGNAKNYLLQSNCSHNITLCFKNNILFRNNQQSIN